MNSATMDHKVVGILTFFVILQGLNGFIEAENGKTMPSFAEKIEELWANRKDKNLDFYEFMAKEVMPMQKQLFKDVDTRVPSEFTRSKPNGIDFQCKLFHNHSNPKSVHRLKPSDIDYVAAMGDSITAAFGADSRNLLEIFTEYRGISWSIGGDKSLKEVVTLPNIIREYYDGVKGFSIKTTPPKIRVPWRAHLNFAVSGAISIGLPAQAEKLIADLKSKKDYKDSWKLLTIWIGGNDLCAICKNDKHTLEKYVGGIRDALDMFHKEVPKMFVNLVQIIDVTELSLISMPYCKVLHKVLCKCGTSAGEEVKEQVRKMAIDYRTGVDKLINSGRYDTRNDFTVVVQPFFTNTKAPRMPDNKTIDMSFFAPDCFHFSEKGHRAAALALWNNMIEPVGKKRLEWTEGEQFECPNKKFPYFFTKKNSREFLQNSFEVEEDIGLGDKTPVKDNVFKDEISMSSVKKGESRGNDILPACLIAGGALMVLAALAVAIKMRRGSYKPLKIDSTPPTYHSI